MTLLSNYGWNNFHDQHPTPLSKNALLFGRVISIRGFKYHLITAKGDLETELAGKLLYGTHAEDLPKVGDWVYYMDYETIGYIVEIIPRRNALTRKNPGTKTEKQVLAANIDHAIIVQGLDRDYNLMRLERYLVQLSACGINPVVVLNKADLIEDVNKYKEEVDALMRNCPLHFCSTYTGSGIKELKENVLEAGKTYILIGSSGVGKSSLLNALLNKDIQQTGSTSNLTAKGKHTTTTRDLFPLPNGSLIIDTPGMREFGLTVEDDRDAVDLFPAIQKFASQCRFSDCQHLNEKGCAVIEAVNAGDLNVTRYDSYLKLIKEQRRFEIKIEDKKRLGKQFGKMGREAKNFRKKNKY